MNLTDTQLLELQSSGDLLASAARHLRDHPNHLHEEAWLGHIAIYARRIAEIVMPQDLRYTP